MEKLVQMFLPLNIVLAQAGDYVNRNTKTPASAIGALTMLPAILFLFWGAIILICLGGFIIWLLMLIDCAKRDFGPNKENDKLIWILVIVLVGWIGAIIYYFAVKRSANIIAKAQQMPINETVSEAPVNQLTNESNTQTK